MPVSYSDHRRYRGEWDVTDFQNSPFMFYCWITELFRKHPRSEGRVKDWYGIGEETRLIWESYSIEAESNIIPEPRLPGGKIIKGIVFASFFDQLLESEKILLIRLWLNVGFESTCNKVIPTAELKAFLFTLIDRTEPKVLLELLSRTKNGN